MVCNLLHYNVVHLVTPNDVGDVLRVRCCEERDEGVFLKLHSVEGAPTTFKWHGRTTVSDPFRHKCRELQCAAEIPFGAQRMKALKTCVRYGVFHSFRSVMGFLARKILVSNGVKRLKGFSKCLQVFRNSNGSLSSSKV